MSLHSFMLTLSAVSIIRGFYLTPKKQNMIIDYQFAFNSNSFYENESRLLILTSALPFADKKEAEERVQERKTYEAQYSTTIQLDGSLTQLEGAP